MSVANLNSAGTLRCKKLVLDGQSLVPSAGGTTLQVGTGAPQSGTITLAGGVTQTGATFTFTGAGGGTTVPTLWSNVAAYAVGAVVSVGTLATPTGTFICIEAVPAGSVGTPNPAPSATATKWTPVAPLAGGSGVASMAGGGATPTLATGAVAFTSTVANGASTALTWTSSATGMELGGTIGGASAGVSSMAGGGATPTLASGAVAFTSTVASGATTALTWTSSATGMELGGTVAGTAGLSPIAYGTVTVPATPGALFNVYNTGATAPPTPNAVLDVKGGTLPTNYTVDALWMFQGAVGGTGTPVAPPNAAIWAPRNAASQTYCAVGAGASFTAGQVLNWVLWAN